MARRELAVAIDGPAGAGKSTVSRQVAARLGYVLVDTGALYRSVALAAKQSGLDWQDDAAVSRLAGDLARRQAIGFSTAATSQKVMLDGNDVTAAIRVPDIGQGASIVSAIPAVREALLDLQRAAADGGGVVLEGRDIGTVVLPEAEAKFFLTASVEVRAQRRFKELGERGASLMTLEAVRRDVEARDERDTMRPVAPLRQAEDAVRVDSSAMTRDEVVDTIVDGVRAVRRALGLGTES